MSLHQFAHSFLRFPSLSEHVRCQGIRISLPGDSDSAIVGTRDGCAASGPAERGRGYSEPVPAGFIVPGSYTISGTPGSSVSLNAKLVVGSPIQIQTPFAAGTVISSSQR